MGIGVAVLSCVFLVLAAPAGAKRKPRLGYSQAYSVASDEAYRLTFNHLYSDYSMESCARTGRLKFFCVADESGADPDGFYPSSTTERFRHTDCKYPINVYVLHKTFVDASAGTPACYSPYWSASKSSYYFPWQIPH